MSSSPVSDVAPVVPVVPVDSVPVDVVDQGVIVSPELDAAVMEYGEPTGVTGIHGECGPGGRRVADVLQCAGSSIGDIPGHGSFGDT